MSNELTFDVELAEIPVKLKNKDKSIDCVIREFDGESRKNYLSGIMGLVNLDVKTTDDDKPSVGISSIKDPTKVAGIKSSLISLCLFTKKDEELVPVTPETILSYPVKTIDGLYEACQKINGLGADAADAAKNELKEKPEDG
jgi:hypothetical protein